MYNYCPHCGQPLGAQPTPPTIPYPPYVYPPTTPLVDPGKWWFGPTVTSGDWWNGLMNVHPNTPATPGNTDYVEEDGQNNG